MLRTIQEKQEILSRLEPSRVVSGCLDDNQINRLIDIYNNSEKNYKNTGPTTVDFFPRKPPFPDWWLEIDQVIGNYIGEHKTFTTNFFEVKNPHILHNDDSIAVKPRLHKTVVIPLRITKPTRFAVFDQCYLDGPIKLRHGGTFGAKNHTAPAVYYNQDLTDNRELEYCTHQPFDKNIWQENFTHLPIERFWGLSVESILTWQPGDIIIFDTARIHCATDFLSQGIENKLGFSIFTGK